MSATTETTEVVMPELTLEQLEQMLAKKRDQEAKLAEKKRKAYEQKKEHLIDTLGGFAMSLSEQMLDLKLEAFRDLTSFRADMLEYADIRGGEKNKGSFELKSPEGKERRYKIVFRSQVNKQFDERAELAEIKLKEFLSTFVKKKNNNAYELIITLLQRNEKTGDFDINLINRLYKMRDKFNNPLWHEALDLFQESYCPNGSAQYVQFYIMNTSNNSWEPIILDFAKLKAFTMMGGGDNDEAGAEA